MSDPKVLAEVTGELAARLLRASENFGLEIDQVMRLCLNAGLGALEDLAAAGIDLEVATDNTDISARLVGGIKVGGLAVDGRTGNLFEVEGRDPCKPGRFHHPGCVHQGARIGGGLPDFSTG